MIVPMLKYTFIAYHLEYDKFLNDIRDIGVLDIVEKIADSRYLSKEKLDYFKSVKQLYNFLEKQKISAIQEIKEIEDDLKRRNIDIELTNITHKKWPEVYSEDLEPYNKKLTQIRFDYYRDKFANKDLQKPELTGKEIFEKVLKFRDRLDAEVQYDLILNKALVKARPWGDFSIETIHKLKENNVDIRLFVSSEKKFDKQWAELYNIEIIKVISPFIYFALVTTPGEEIELDAEEVNIPEETISQVEKRKLERFEDITIIEQELNYIALNYTEDLNNYILKLEEEIDFANVLTNTESAVEDNVRIIEAYIPKNETEKLNDYLNEQCVAYFIERPNPNDKIPIKQKNNRFAKLFEPIGQLFSLPAYMEMDLTPYFAPFFMMFFGFCLGDVGYGLFILAGATLYKRKAKPEIKPIITLAQFLGIGTIILGTLTGTFFGINLLEVESLGKFRNIMLDSQKVFYLSLAVGMFQILFGMALKAINGYRMMGWQYAMSPVGWIVMMFGIIDVAITKLAPGFNMYLIYAGIAIVVAFSDPTAGVFGRLGKGIWELYGISGIFGDVLSYVRLFALGISGAILGFVVNTIALQIKDSAPIIGPIFFVLFLIVGHTANLLISSLGAFVHPMRLTFVEFYKNAGFIGGGKEYKPFKNKLLINKEK
jgi:V/A-type H+/Na+-transporting ATPase subunit I